MVSTNLNLLNELLSEIYTDSTRSSRSVDSRLSLTSRGTSKCRCSISSNESNASNDSHLNVLPHHALCELIKCNYAHLDTSQVHELIGQLTRSIHAMNSDLVTSLRHRDFLYTEQSQLCDFITATLQAFSAKRGSDGKPRFSIEAKTATDSSYKQWVDAMRMVVRLPGGIPPEFRRKLWITLSEKYIQSKQINWQGKIESCFSERANPDDESLGEQIIKDLHRTGCDLFSGADASVNQALLKQVLLAFARWNKSVGYCQGFNILAAVILEVVEWKVEEALMVMIFLIEGLLPESYFANNLRGLSVDMAVFRDLMKMHLNDLSNHLDHLQYSSLEGVACYEPPLVNVFTLQWFLTLFSNCLPKSLVLRIWDLIFLEGSEILLRTALTIWSNLSQQIYSVKSADEFYSIMGILTMQLMEYTTTDGNQLITDIINLADFPYVKVSELREKYTYHIRPLSSTCNSPSASSFSGSNSPFSFVKKGLHLLPFTSSSDEDDVNSNDHFEFFFHQDQLISSLARPASPSVSDASPNKSRSINSSTSGTSSPDRMSLDVSLLRKQYVKLCQRQKQAHLILTEGLRYGYSSTFNRSSSPSSEPSKSANSQASKKCHDKSTINSLLSSKPALTLKTSGKQPMVALPPTIGKLHDKSATATTTTTAAAAAVNTAHSNDKSDKEHSRSEGKAVTDNNHRSSDTAQRKGDSGSTGGLKNKQSANVTKDITEKVCASDRESCSKRHSTGKSSAINRSTDTTVDAKREKKVSESCSDSQDDEYLTSEETSVTSDEQAKTSVFLSSSHSSSTSVNNSSSSSSLESHASSVSTVDTVVTKKRKKSDETSINNGQGKRDTVGQGDADSSSKSTSTKSTIVVVRRRFGPNVRRASSILEQSSFSVDEPVEGDDESTSSDCDDCGQGDIRNSTSKQQGSSHSSAKGVSSKRKDFQRRHQNTLTLTWSEIRKIRKTSAPASVIRSSLSSPPTDLSPANDDVARSRHPDDALTDDSCENSSESQSKQQQDGQTEPRDETIEDNGSKESPTRASLNVTDNNGSHCDDQLTVLTVSPVASPITSPSTAPQRDTNLSHLDTCAVESRRESSTGVTEQSSTQEQADPMTRRVSIKSVHTAPPLNELNSPGSNSAIDHRTKGPVDQDTECESNSHVQINQSPASTSPVKSVHQTSNAIEKSDVIEDTHSVEVTCEGETEGEDRIIKSVQSEISNLTIEECLARLSARISTLNSELQ